MRLRRRVLRSFAYQLARSWAIDTDLTWYGRGAGTSEARRTLVGRGQTTLAVQLVPALRWEPAMSDPRVHEAAAFALRRLAGWIERGNIRASWITRCVLESMIVPGPVAGRGPGLVVSACSILDDRGRCWSAGFRLGTLGRETV